MKKIGATTGHLRRSFLDIKKKGGLKPPYLS